jgi:hypothetical protein
MGYEAVGPRPPFRHLILLDRRTAVETSDPHINDITAYSTLVESDDARANHSPGGPDTGLLPWGYYWGGDPHRPSTHDDRYRSVAATFRDDSGIPPVARTEALDRDATLRLQRNIAGRRTDGLGGGCTLAPCGRAFSPVCRVNRRNGLDQRSRIRMRRPVEHSLCITHLDYRTLMYHRDPVSHLANNS